ncbi:unnamed protein product [Prunus armeniaca]
MLLKDFASRYATGDEVYMADVFLAPQIFVSTTRFNINMVNSCPLLCSLLWLLTLFCSLLNCVFC